MNDPEPFRRLQEFVGEPTEASLESLRLMQLDCESRKDPNSFYLTFNISDPPIINWSHNADRLLGVSNLDYEEYYTRIHPTWFPLHVGFGTAAYLIGRRLFGKDSEDWANYTINVPFRHGDGTYHWYNQVSVPATFDSERRMVSHLNQYHRLCPFDRLVPSRPKMNYKAEWEIMDLGEEFARAGNGAIKASLAPLLTPANLRIVHTYRKLSSIRKGGGWGPPAKKEVREALGLSSTAINKANVRIIQALKGEFPGSVTSDVASFATFLNELCGHPEASADK